MKHNMCESIVFIGGLAGLLIQRPSMPSIEAKQRRYNFSNIHGTFFLDAIIYEMLRRKNLLKISQCDYVRLSATQHTH